MSWMDLDDKLLDHPKFIRAVKRGGSEVVHLWLGLRQYVAQQLTDGFIPDDMVDEVRGPHGRKREQALAVLREVGLVDAAEGGVQLHDFLQWSKSRDQILKQREANRLRQAKSRDRNAVTDTVTNADVTPSVTLPSPLLSTPHHTKPDESVRVAPCPLDLTSKAEALGIISEFAEKYRAEPEQIRKSADEFVSYWTIGGGMGRNEANWPKKLREHLRRTCEKPGGLEPPGAIEHAQKRRNSRGKGGAPSALAEVIGDYVPSENVPYHQPWSPKS